MHFQLNILLPHSGKSTRLIALHYYVDPDTCPYLRRGLIGSLANGYIAVIRTKSVTHIHSAPNIGGIGKHEEDHGLQPSVPGPIH